MTHFIHRSQIILYLQGVGLSELEVYADVSLAEHGNTVEWNLNGLSHTMTFNSVEQAFIID